MKFKTDNREMESEVRCGIGSFHPPCLRRLVGVRSFIGVFGTLALMSWALYTVTVSQITNIEKAFGLSSSESGWMMTTWELGYLLCTIVASYFGPRAHIPLVMGFATVICGISGLVTAMPHFFVYVDSFDETDSKENTTASNANLCRNTSDLILSSSSDSLSAADIAGSSRKTLAYSLLIIGMILQGGGKAPCYPYSSKYLDDSVNKQNTGYYVGIISSIGIIGLVIGYGLGALVNKNYVTFEDVDIGPKDPRFIGAWWLGFIVLGFATILIAIPLMCFPKTLKPERNLQEDGHIPRKKVFVLRKELKAIGRTVVSILKSPIYTLTVIASVLQVLSFSSFLSFEPKYLETQFAVPAWQSNLIIGVAGISSFCIGSLLGGFITKMLKMTPLLTLQLVVGAYTGVLALLVVQMFLGCEQPQIINPYGEITGNLTCDCSGVQYLPICGADHRNYYSPCHAGCTDGTTHAFSNCTLIPGGTASSGLCPNDCRMLWPFAVTKFILSSIDSLSWVPLFLIFLRTATEEQKAMALGLSAAITSGFAWLPGPAIGGKLIDSTCLIWKTASNSGIFCGQYDIVAQRFKLHELMLGLRAGCLLFLIAAMVMAKKNNRWRSEDKPTETREKEKMMNGQSCNDAL